MKLPLVNLEKRLQRFEWFFEYNDIRKLQSNNHNLSLKENLDQSIEKLYKNISKIDEYVNKFN